MQEKYLPIGSVVLLKNAEKRVMITGFCCLSLKDENKIYDYCGCIYPEGVINSEGTLLFNHDKIDKICAVGYRDEECSNFIENLKKISTHLEQKLKNNNSVFKLDDIEIL